MDDLLCGVQTFNSAIHSGCSAQTFILIVLIGA